MGMKMVQARILHFFLYFHLTRTSEIISGTPLQFLIDFSIEEDLKSILIIKEEDKGRILNVIIKEKEIKFKYQVRKVSF